MSEGTITVTVHPDLLPELNEVTVVELTEITENGAPPGSDSTRGAQLVPGRTRSFITVQANDAPHGVLVWSTSRVAATEEDAVDSGVELTILREFGSIGAILISYRYTHTQHTHTNNTHTHIHTSHTHTSQATIHLTHHNTCLFSTSVDTNAPLEDQATPGLDFLPTTSSVTMGDNVTSATVSITILHVSYFSINFRHLLFTCVFCSTVLFNIVGREVHVCDYGYV